MMLNGRKIMTIGEYEDYLGELRRKVSRWKEMGMGSEADLVRNLAKEVTKSAGSSRELMLTATQLREIFELAK